MKSRALPKPVGGLTARNTFAAMTSQATRGRLHWGRLTSLLTLLLLMLQGLGLKTLAADFASVNTAFPNLDVKIFNGNVNVVLPRPDGKVYVGGYFNVVGGSPRTHLALVDSLTGEVDSSFVVNLDDRVYALALGSDGKLYVGGDFTTVGGVTRNRLALVDGATGELDSNFDPNVDSNVRALMLKRDGKLYVGGLFTSVGGVTRNRLALVDGATGAVDGGFDPNVSGTVNALVLRSDGKLYVGGLFTSVGGVTRNRLALVDGTTGVVDNSFDPNVGGGVYDLALRSDGKLYVGGFFGSVGGVARSRLALVDGTTGVVDNSFDANMGGIVYDLAFRSDGKLYVGGLFSSVGGVARRYLALVDGTTGVMDNSFDPNMGGRVNALALRSDGKLYVGGNFLSAGGLARHCLALVDGTTGVPEESFQPPIQYESPGTIEVVLPTADGKIYIGGSFHSVSGVGRNQIALVDAGTGAVDDSFDPNVNGPVHDLALRSDGKLYVGGSFTSVGGVIRNRLALIDGVTGAVDGSFDPEMNDEVLALALRSDGKVFAGGNFTSVGGISRNRLALVDGVNGALDNTFYPQVGGEVRVLLARGDGGLYVGGLFTSVGGVTRNRLALVDGATGAVDGGFDPNVSGTVNDLAFRSDGKLYVGGLFTSVGGVTRNRLALVNGTTGALDGDFDPGYFNDSVIALILRADGKLYVGGGFTTAGGVTRNRLALLDGVTGSVDGVFDPNINQTVNDLALAGDDKLFVAGAFTAVDAMERTGLALLDVTTIPTPTPTLQELNTAAILSGGNYTLTGNASFTDTRNGIDSNINTLPGNEPFAQGAIVRSLTNLTSDTNLQLGDAAAAQSVINVTANPFYLGLNWDYSPNSGLLAITNSKANLTVENVSLVSNHASTSFSSSTEAGGTNHLNNTFSVFQFLNTGAGDASTHSLNLKDSIFTGYPLPGGSSQQSLFLAQRFPTDPAATNLSTAAMAGSMDFNAVLDNVTLSNFSLAGKIIGVSSASLTLKGGSQILQPLDQTAYTHMLEFRDIRGQSVFNLMDSGTLLQSSRGPGVQFINSGTVNVEERFSESTIHISGGAIVTGVGRTTAENYSCIVATGQKDVAFMMSGGSLSSLIGSSVRLNQNGLAGSSVHGVHFNMSGGLIEANRTELATPVASYTVELVQNSGIASFTLSGGEIRNAHQVNFSDAVRIHFNNDPAGLISVNLLGGTIISSWDDPDVAGAPVAWDTGAVRYYKNGTPGSVVIGDALSGNGPLLDGNRYGLLIDQCTAPVSFTLHGGILKSRELSNSTWGLGSSGNTERVTLQLLGGLVTSPVAANARALYLSGNNTVVIGSGNDADPDSKMIVEGVRAIDVTSGSSLLPVDITLRNGATLKTLYLGSGSTSYLVLGHTSVELSETVIIQGGTLSAPTGPVTQRVIDLRGGDDTVELIYARSSNLTRVDLGYGNDRLVLDAAFPRDELNLLRGGGSVAGATPANDGIDTLRLQGGINLGESITDDTGIYRGFNNLELAVGASMTVSQTLESAGGEAANANNNVVLERLTPGPLTGAVGSGSLLVGDTTYPFINAGGGVDTITLINVTGLNASMFGPAGSTDPNHLFRGFEVVNLGAGSQWTGSLDLAAAGLTAFNPLPGSQFTGSMILTTGDDLFTYQGGSNVDVYGNGGIDTLVLASGTTVDGANLLAGSPLDTNLSEFLDFTHLVLEDGSSLTGSYVTGAADNILTLYGTASRGSVNLGLGTDSLVLGTSGSYSQAILDFTSILGVEQIFLSTTGDARNTGSGDDLWNLDASDASLSVIDARLNSAISDSVLGDTLVVPAGQTLAGGDFGAGARYRGFEAVSLAGSITGTLVLDSGTNTLVIEQGYDLSAGSVDAGAGTDYVRFNTTTPFAGNGSKFQNVENIHLNNALSDTWNASVTDSLVVNVEAGTAVDGSDVDILDLSNATGTVRDNTANALVGAGGKYRSFERVLLGEGDDTWQAGSTSGVVSALNPGYIDAGAGTDILEISTGASIYQASGLIGASSPYRNFEELRINHGSSPVSYVAHATQDPASVVMVGSAEALLVVNSATLAVLSEDVGDASGAYQGFDSLSIGGDVAITTSQFLGSDGSLEISRSTPATLGSIQGANAITAGSGTENQATLGNVTGLVPADFAAASGALRGFEKLKLTAGSGLTGSHSAGDALESIRVEVGANASVTPGLSGTASLVMKGLDLSTGGTYACEVAAAACDLIQVPDGTLTLGGASKLVLQAVAPDGLVYVIATYDALSGTFATVENLPAGYNLVYGYQGKRIALVKNTYYGFGAWAYGFGITLNGNASDYTADTDGDGRGDLDEYLLGGDPLVDDVPPVIATPEGGFTPLAFVVAPGSTATLPDYLAQALISDPSGVASSSQSPVAGTVLNAGSHEITLTATDTLSNVGSLTLNVHVVSTHATLSLSAARYTVHQGATSTVVTLTRTGHLEPASVTLKTADGTASIVPPFSAAVAGTDYTAVDTVVGFDAGETSKTVTLALSPKTGKQPNKRFTLSLSSPGAGAELGAVATASVHILANDTTKPVLKVATPVASARALSAAIPYLVTGTAGDANGIDRVEVVLNGAAPVSATLGSSTKNSNIPWSLEIAPVEGNSNTLAVTAYDLRGNASVTVTRTFTFTRRYPLTVTRSAPGVVSKAGTLKVEATPKKAATGFLPAAAEANPKVSQILPGVPVKLTALPLKGHVFSHWAVKPAGAMELGNVLSFTMPAQDVAAEAVFVTRLFEATNGQGDTFYGLLSPDEGVATGNHTVGWFMGTIVPSRGSFSGQVMIDGLNKKVAGTFHGDNSMVFSQGKIKSRTISVGNRSMTLSIDSTGISVALSEGVTQVAGGLAKRAHYSNTNQVPVAMLNRKTRASLSANDQGFFTVALPSKAQVPVKDITTYPQGDGYGSVTLSNLGVVTMVGTLADGSTFLGSSGMVSSDAFPVYAQLATPGAASAAVKGGSISGELMLDVTQADSDVSGTDLLWIRPAVTQMTGTTPKATATQLYTEGWPTGLRVDAVGAFYDKAKDARTGLGLGAANATTGNAELLFTDGKLTEDVRVSAFNIEAGTASASKVTKIPTTNGAFTLVVTQGLGQFSGTFTPNWTNPVVKKKPLFRGVLIQKGGSKGGYGYFISNRSEDSDPEAGRVTLGAPTP